MNYEIHFHMLTEHENDILNVSEVSNNYSFLKGFSLKKIIEELVFIETPGNKISVILNLIDNKMQNINTKI